MPLYHVKYIAPLTDSQQDQLAAAITEIHSEKFTTPKLFVNVMFEDVSRINYYVSGKRRKCNSVIGYVRTGPGRSQQEWDSVCTDIGAAWASIVHPKTKSPEPVEDLRFVACIGGMVAAWEAGITVAQAGQDKAWIKDNWELFKSRAAAGDGDFQDLIEDIQSRPAFQS